MSTLLLVASFFGVIYLGHVPLMFMILAIQVPPGLALVHNHTGESLSPWLHPGPCMVAQPYGTAAAI